MKIRKGFVSNSSSSSFVAWGVSKDEITILDEIYLERFNKQLEYYDKQSKDSGDSYYEKYGKQYHEKMLPLKTDVEKVEYAKKHFEIDKSKNEFEQGGQENYFVGMRIGHILAKHSELRFGEVKEFVAKKLNETYGTNFQEQDIHYIEEGWYNG